MSVCKLYFVLLLLYAVINLLGERLQTAQTEERWEKGRGEVTSISVSVLLFQKDIQESDFIFVFLCVFRTECTYLDAEDFVVSKFCEISSLGETVCIIRWETPVVVNSSQPSTPWIKVLFYFLLLQREWSGLLFLATTYPSHVTDLQRLAQSQNILPARTGEGDHVWMCVCVRGRHVCHWCLCVMFNVVGPVPKN